MLKKKKIYIIRWRCYLDGSTLIGAKSPEQALKKFYKMSPGIPSVKSISEYKMDGTD